jgi:hypothetical protein
MYVIGINLQLRGRGSPGGWGEAEAAVGLPGVSLFGAWGYEDMSVEDGRGLPPQDTFYQFMTFTARRGMNHAGVCFDALLIVKDSECKEGTVCALALDINAVMVLRMAVMECDGMEEEVGGLCLPDGDVTATAAIFTALLNIVILQRSAWPQMNLHFLFGLAGKVVTG